MTEQLSKVHPKGWHSSIKFLMIFLISLLICFEVPKFFSGEVTIYVNVSEIPAVGEYFSFEIGTIVEIILMGPVFGVLYFILMKAMLRKIDESQNRKVNYIYLLEIGAVILICLVVMGHIVHLMFDYANALYRQTYGGYDTTPLFLFLYHSDEWLGHSMIHIGLFGFIVLALVSESLMKAQRRMRWYEIGLSIFFSFGLFVMNGYATLEGQCAALLAIMSFILLLIEIIVIMWKKINPIHYPILFTTIIANIIVIGFFTYWIITFGMKPYYPFYFQPSEL